MTETLDLQLEEVARAISLAMRAHLPGAIDSVWDDMVAEDATYYAAIGESVPVTPKQYPAHYFLGHHPSILEREPADYPNVTTVTYQHRSTFDTMDQLEIAGNNSYVEAFVLHDDEQTVNRLAWRYAKAMHRVFAEHRDLDDTRIWYITYTPNADISNAAARRVSQFSEDITFIQGCRMEYQLRTSGTW